MDRAKIKAQETFDLDITYPSGKPADMTVTLQNMDSPEPRKVLKKWDRIGSKRKGGLDFEQKEQAAVELLSACIVGWTGYTNEGEPIPCDADTKRELLGESELRFVRLQIDETLGDTSNFLSISASD